MGGGWRTRVSKRDKRESARNQHAARHADLVTLMRTAHVHAGQPMRAGARRPRRTAARQQEERAPLSLSKPIASAAPARPVRWPTPRRPRGAGLPGMIAKLDGQGALGCGRERLGAGRGGARSLCFEKGWGQPLPPAETHGVAEARVEAIAQLLDAGRDLVEGHGHPPPVALDDIHPGAALPREGGHAPLVDTKGEEEEGPAGGGAGGSNFWTRTRGCDHACRGQRGWPRVFVCCSLLSFGVTRVLSFVCVCREERRREQRELMSGARVD